TSRLTDADLDSMQAALDQMAAITEPNEFQRLDMGFHATYHRAAGNPPLLELVNTIWLELRRFDRAGYRSLEVVAANREHRQILAAFRAGDAEKAAVAARLNWTRSWERIEWVLNRLRKMDRGNKAGAGTT